jgi:hypothetical protein
LNERLPLGVSGAGWGADWESLKNWGSKTPEEIEADAALQVQQFSASTSMEEVPGTPEFHEALARAALDMGLPVPKWYRGKSAR